MDTNHTTLITAVNGCSLSKGQDVYTPARRAGMTGLTERVDLVYVAYLVYLVCWFVWLVWFFDPNQPTRH